MNPMIQSEEGLGLLSSLQLCDDAIDMILPEVTGHWMLLIIINLDDRQYLYVYII